ncbi:Hypothetical predicted protein [Paramuricea clavata]|uniref:Uncharacterized protein n=1 Tax=Paramuricea clavata TaxID=317549 RepID=A0A7D9K1P0_PARCT|nr:Hypothetical predicted protein [Paramuricea clavata]
MAVEQATNAPIIHGIQPPTGLDLKSRNKAENWKAYKQRWENYIIVTQLDKQPEEYRVALFIYCIGQEAVKVYNSFDLAPEDKRKLVKIIDEFDKRDNTNQVKEADSSSDSEYIDSVTVKPDKISSISQQPSKEVYAKMIVRGNPIKFHVDCGATVNVLPMKYLAEFMAVEENLTPLLGAKAIQRMGIVELHNENFEQVAQVNTGIKDTTSTQSATTVTNRIIEEFADVFEGEVGTLEGEEHLEVDPTGQPTTAQSRRVPFAVKAKVKDELMRLTNLEVIQPVDEPTDWVSNMVVATKPSGQLRMCIDPKQLKKALKRERYPIPVIEDVMPDIAKAKVFTKVDARNGYWHVMLNEESSRLTTFDTPFGRYR